MRRTLPLLAALPLLLVALSGSAVVETTGDGSGNTTSPADDPGFANVGTSSNGLTGVYLGNRWVLSAAHVGERDFVFDGVTYPAVTGSRVVISKDGNTADLEMVRVWGHPPLPALTLSTASPALGDAVVMIGNGWNREPGLTCWNGAWGEVSCPGGAYSGYKRSTGRALRWGKNLVTDVDLDVPTGSHLTRSFATDFDEAGIADEAQVVTGDSGGGVFLKRGGQWQLVGIQFAMSVLDVNQPANTAVFGDASILVDLSYYRNEILAVLDTPPQVPLAPWPLLVLGYGVLLACGRRALGR